MTVTRKWVKSLPEKTQKQKQEKAHYQYIVDAYEANDKWAIKATYPIGVLLTSHPGNRPFLKASLETHKKLGYWTSVVYDNYFDPDKKDTSFDHLMPARDVFDNIDTFIHTHHQTWGGVLYPYFWSLKFGLQTMGGFEYIWCSNGDCVIEKPENFEQIIDMLGDGDIIGCGWEKNGSRPLFNTTSFLGKSKAIQAIMQHFQDHLIPLDNYEKYAQEMGNTEARFAKAILDLGLKLKKVPKNPFNTQSHKPGGTFYDIIGFRHIHGEFNYACKYHKIPPEPKYLDRRYLGPRYDFINKYYKTKKDEWLQKFWGTWRKPR